MRLLLDTCVFLWLATEPSKLSPVAKVALDDERNELFLSDASIWEIVLKHKAGKLPLPEAPRQWIPDELQFHGIQSVPITSEAIFLVAELPGEHRDPFDRLIAAQVRFGGFQLVSPDKAFKTLGIEHSLVRKSDDGSCALRRAWQLISRRSTNARSWQMHRFDIAECGCFCWGDSARNACSCC